MKGLHDQEDKKGKLVCSRKHMQAQVLTSRGCYHTLIFLKKGRKEGRKLDGKMSLEIKREILMKCRNKLDLTEMGSFMKIAKQK